MSTIQATHNAGSGSSKVQLNQSAGSRPDALIRVQTVQIPREVKTAVSRAVSKGK